MKKLNTLWMELNDIINAYCVTEVLQDYITFEQYKEIVNEYWRMRDAEQYRIKATKGKVRNQHLKEGKTYKIEDFENDILREELISDMGVYYRIVPNYKNKYEYVSYDFKRIDRETVQFIKRTSHS